MKTSVLLVSYNHELYIEEAISSILMQRTSFDYEIIVVDDCSTDRTKEITEGCLKKTEVKYKILESEKNLGIAKNYQRGFENCFSEYIAVLEGDDYWTDPYRLQKHIDFLDKHKECVMTFNRASLSFVEKKAFAISNCLVNISDKYYATKDIITGAPAFNFSTYVYRNSAIKMLDKGIFDLNIADWMLNICISQYGLICGLGEVMSVYRVHSKGSWSGISQIKQHWYGIQLAKEYDRFLNYRLKKEFMIVKLKNWKGLFRSIIVKIIKIFLFIK